MASYSFKVRQDISEITADRGFHEACLDSIRGGNPLMVPLEEENREITCLEYILDAVTSVSPMTYTDIRIFEDLAHSSIDLNQTLCHTPYEYDSISTCIPKILDSYVSVGRFDYHLLENSKKNASVLLDKGIAYRRLNKAMQTILTKYPHLFQETTCRPHHSITRHGDGDDRDKIACFEKLLLEGQAVDFIDTNQLPDGFLDYPMCHPSFSDHGITTCYKRIIESALSNDNSTKYPYLNQNARRLLVNIIESKKFEQQLYTMSRHCGSAESCLDKMLEGSHIAFGGKIIETMLNTYSDGDGLIDTKTETSPFSGEKCTGASYGKYENCLDTTAKTISALLGSYDEMARAGAIQLGTRLAAQPQFSGDCGTLKFLSLITDYDAMSGQSDNDHARFATRIADKVMPAGSTYAKTLRMFDCVSNIVTPHRIDGFDYALELGVPINHHLFKTQDVPMLLEELTAEPCTSISTGEKMPCLQKLVEELLIDYETPEPRMNENSKAIIKVLLGASGSVASTYLYPKGKVYFTDTLTDALHNAVSVNSSVSSEAIGMLDVMIHSMGNHMGETGEKFASDTYPRFGKIIDIITEAPIKYPGKDHRQRFEYPTPIRGILGGSFEHSEDDIEKALRSGLFEYGKRKRIIEVLSRWFEEYKDSSRIRDAIVYTLEKTHKKTLIEFFKSYNHKEQGRADTDKDVVITPQVEQLFEYIYKKPMDEYFATSLESRMLYDELCFSNPKADDYAFLDSIYNDIAGNSKLQHDPKGIVGVYDVTVGNTGMWGTGHIMQYGAAISSILHGSEQPIGEPYVTNPANMHPVPTGLLEAVHIVSDIEYIGKRIDNIKGKLAIEVYPNFTPGQLYNDPDGFVHAFRAEGNDFTVHLYYVGTDEIIIEHTRTQFKMLESLQKMPKKLKKKVQAKYPLLFGQLDAVVAKEASDSSKAVKPQLDTYKMVISNKPADIARSSACQGWTSCMSVFGGGNNAALGSYIDYGSYIAYLTKNSEYEPQWLARMFLHKCSNCNCVSIQDRLRHYEVSGGSDRSYPNWNLLYSAVQVALADKGINNIQHNRDCTFEWGGNLREDIENNGDDRCNEEMSERQNDCENECKDNCESDSAMERYLENISSQVQEEIDTRVAKALEEHRDDDGELTITDREVEQITEDIETEVHEGLEDELVGEEIQDCRDGCAEECESVNDDFDCFGWLADNGMLDDDEGDVYTDGSRIQALRKDNDTYKSILLERTGQMETSQAFVRQVKTVF